MTDQAKTLIPDLPTEEWVPKIQAGIHNMIQKARPKIQTGVQEIKDVITQQQLHTHQPSSTWTKPAVAKTSLAIGTVIAITAGICLYAYWRRDDVNSEDESQGLYPLLKNEKDSTLQKIKSAWNKFWNRE
jgi:hypothetical protein